MTFTEGVRRYYDNNAAAFERLGQGGASIHRAVWGPGVTTRAEAFHHVDELILAALPPDALSPDAAAPDAAESGAAESGAAESGAAKPTVVDLGCGLGASLLYLAGRRAGLTGEGITLSPAQAARASELIAEAGAAGRVRCRVGDYLDLPEDLIGVADLTFSIEAFIHSPDAGRYFEQATRTLRPGGRLIICDDFLTRNANATPRGLRWLAEFRTGWHAGSLFTVGEVRDVAARHGLALVRDVDLTGYLELRRPRDRWVSLLLALGRPLRLSGDYWQSLVGGNALQHALIHGLLSYRFLELVKVQS